MSFLEITEIYSILCQVPSCSMIDYMSKETQVIVSKSDLISIKKLIHEDDASKNAEDDLAKSLHYKSMKNVRNWTNTVEGSRRLKHETLQKRLQEEELRLQEIDLEEAAYQKNVKLNTLKRAKDIVQENSEAYRVYIKQTMLQDTIKENAEHDRIKKDRKELEERRDAYFTRMYNDDYRTKLEREVREKEAQIERNRQTGVIRSKQLDAQKEKRIQEFEEWYLEGEMVARKAANDLEAEKFALGKRKEQAIKALKETEAANAYLEELKCREKEREKQEEILLNQHSQKHQILKAALKKRETDLHDQTMATRARLIEVQANRLRELRDTEDARISKEVEELRQREEKIMEEKEGRVRTQKAMIDKHRSQQLEEMRIEKTREKQESLQERADVYHVVRNLEEKEQTVNNIRRSEAKRVAEFQKRQTELRRWKETTQKARDDAFGQKMIEKAMRLY